MFYNFYILMIPEKKSQYLGNRISEQDLLHGET